MSDHSQRLRARAEQEGVSTKELLRRLAKERGISVGELEKRLAKEEKITPRQFRRRLKGAKPRCESFTPPEDDPDYESPDEPEYEPPKGWLAPKGQLDDPARYFALWKEIGVGVKWTPKEIREDDPRAVMKRLRGKPTIRVNAEFIAGVRAALAGLPITADPYDHRTAWITGWKTAFADRVIRIRKVLGDRGDCITFEQRLVERAFRFGAWREPRLDSVMAGDGTIEVRNAVYVGIDTYRYSITEVRAREVSHTFALVLPSLLDLHEQSAAPSATARALEKLALYIPPVGQKRGTGGGWDWQNDHVRATWWSCPDQFCIITGLGRIEGGRVPHLFFTPGYADEFFRVQPYRRWPYAVGYHPVTALGRRDDPRAYKPKVDGLIDRFTYKPYDYLKSDRDKGIRAPSRAATRTVADSERAEAAAAAALLTQVTNAQPETHEAAKEGAAINASLRVFDHKRKRWVEPKQQPPELKEQNVVLGREFGMRLDPIMLGTADELARLRAEEDEVVAEWLRARGKKLPIAAD